MISREVIEKETAGLSDNHLFDLARNASAPIETRTFAAEKLLDKGAFQAAKAEISGLIEEIKAERLKVTAGVEEAVAEVSETNAGEPSLLSASFTTSSIQ
jgi:hypothetical protein